MPRFRHKRTGLFVIVGDARAGSLSGSEWERADVPVKDEKPASAPRRRKRKADDDN